MSSATTFSRASAAVLVAAAVTMGVVAAGLSQPGTPSMRTFEPDRLADLELRMWQAYYAKQNVRLFGLVVAMLREQYHYSWTTAAIEGFHLARAAAVFGQLRSGYDAVLPDLEHAYATADNRTSSRFDPAAVARAELAWWVARRTPGHDDPEQVGRLIAREYALLYDVPPAAVARAGLLRAQAAALRDAEASRPDWRRIGALLRDSYRALHAVIAAPDAALTEVR